MLRALSRSLVMLCASSALASAAQAQDALPLELEWRAPAECADEQAVRAELSRIAHARAGYALSPLTARGAVEKRGARYVLRLYTEHTGRSGERTLEAPDCETLVRSVTLVLALAFGPGVELQASEPAPSTSADPPAPDPTPEPEPVLVPAAEPEPEPEPELEPERDADAPGAPLHLSLVAGASAQLALLPSAALALTLGAALDARPWSISLRITAVPGVDEAIASDAHARFDALGAALLGCHDFARRALRADLCAGARALALRGRTSGALEDGDSVAPLYALLGAVALAYPADAVLSVRLEAQLALALHRPRFVVENLGRAHRVPQWAPELAAFVVLNP